MAMRDAWQDRADSYLRWARTPGHDVGYWNFNRPCLLDLLPYPGQLTVDIGCGEGRWGRSLLALGHRVVGIEVSLTLAAAALGHPTSQPTIVGDAGLLPVRTAAADLVTASMVLMDIDDLDGTVAEAARVLAPGGRFCFSILHPVNTAGGFTHRDDVSAPFVLTEDYFEDRERTVAFERDGLEMRFTHHHRPLAAYVSALARAGFVIEDLREPMVGPEVAPANPNWERWRRVPNSLHIRARRL